jgi:hypothetical protein
MKISFGRVPPATLAASSLRLSGRPKPEAFGSAVAGERRNIVIGGTGLGDRVNQK